jgi:RHS repeat-associated protein
VIERLAYDPFGKRRFTNGAYDQVGTIDATSTSRGFTGHEHLDELDFIHMNARVYDPDIGRFLSPDPTVPYINNPQAFNRYAYAVNNPLNYVDKDGFSFGPSDSRVSGIAEVSAIVGESLKGAEGSDKKGDATTNTANDTAPGTQIGSPSAPGVRPGDTVVAQAQVLANPATLGNLGRLGLQQIEKAARATAAGLAAIAAAVSTFQETVNEKLGLTTNQVKTEDKADEGKKTDAAGKGSSGVAGGSTPPEVDNDGKKADESKKEQDDRQSKGRPQENTKQNKQVDDAAKDEKLSKDQRYQLKEEVEYESRTLGRNLGYKDLREIAREIKDGVR